MGPYQFELSPQASFWRFQQSCWHLLIHHSQLKVELLVLHGSQRGLHAGLHMVLSQRQILLPAHKMVALQLFDGRVAKKRMRPVAQKQKSLRFRRNFRWFARAAGIDAVVRIDGLGSLRIMHLVPSKRQYLELIQDHVLGGLHQ